MRLSPRNRKRISDLFYFTLCMVVVVGFSYCVLLPYYTAYRVAVSWEEKMDYFIERSLIIEKNQEEMIKDVRHLKSKLNNLDRDLRGAALF